MNKLSTFISIPFLWCSLQNRWSCRVQRVSKRCYTPIPSSTPPRWWLFWFEDTTPSTFSRHIGTTKRVRPKQKLLHTWHCRVLLAGLGEKDWRTCAITSWIGIRVLVSMIVFTQICFERKRQKAILLYVAMNQNSCFVTYRYALSLWKASMKCCSFIQILYHHPIRRRQQD